MQLSNLAVRRCRLAFLAALGGDAETARDQLDQAHIEGMQSYQLRPDENVPSVIASRLISRANLALVELERTSLLINDLDERAAALEEVERTLRTILVESYETSFVLPRARLSRATHLAMAIVEQAQVWEKRGDLAKAKSVAWTARVGMKADHDVYQIDADEPLESAVRYGDACRLSGAKAMAVGTWQRSRDRLALFHGAEYPAVKTLDKRIAELRFENK
jgi:hypothetical protein